MRQPFWKFLAAILDFIGSSGIKLSNLSTSFLTICKNHAPNENYSLKSEIRGAPTSKYCNLRLFYGIPAAILDFRKCSRVSVSHPVGSFSVPFVEQKAEKKSVSDISISWLNRAVRCQPNNIFCASQIYNIWNYNIYYKNG